MVKRFFQERAGMAANTNRFAPEAQAVEAAFEPMKMRDPGLTYLLQSPEVRGIIEETPCKVKGMPIYLAAFP